jgi:hypothetical protein
MIASNLRTLEAKPLTLREANDMVLEVSSKDGEEREGAKLCAVEAKGVT